MKWRPLVRLSGATSYSYGDRQLNEPRHLPASVQKRRYVLSLEGSITNRRQNGLHIQDTSYRTWFCSGQVVFAVNLQLVYLEMAFIPWTLHVLSQMDSGLVLYHLL